MRPAHRRGPTGGHAHGAPLHLLRVEALSAAHLARRFFGALRPGAPPGEDEAWVASVLLPSELALWQRLSAPDRRHAIGVARGVDAAVPSAPRAVLAAALLHDVGKLDSGLGTFARVPATVVGMVWGRERAAGWRGRVGAYLDHPARGAALLRAAGSDPLTVAWAGEHHRPEASWSVPPPYAAALAAADDD